MNTNGLDSKDFDRDKRVQVEAERAERAGLAPGRDPEVDRHRLIVRALREPLEPQLPDDFAARVSKLAAQRSGTGVEDFLVTSLLLVMGIIALLFVGPALAKAAQMVVSGPLAGQLPWRQLGTAAICIGLVWAIDSGWMRRHPAS